MADPWKYASPHLCYRANFGQCGQTVRAYYGDLPDNFDPSRWACQGHSMSLEPTRIDQPHTTSYYCSIVTVRLSVIVFEIKGNICKKN